MNTPPKHVKAQTEERIRGRSEDTPAQSSGDLSDRDQLTAAQGTTAVPELNG